MSELVPTASYEFGSCTETKEDMLRHFGAFFNAEPVKRLGTMELDEVTFKGDWHLYNWQTMDASCQFRIYFSDDHECYVIEYTKASRTGFAARITEFDTPPVRARAISDKQVIATRHIDFFKDGDVESICLSGPGSKLTIYK